MSDKIKEPEYYHTRIKDWPESERPREKMQKHGAHSLSNAELIAIILREGTGNITALDLAKRLVMQQSSLTELSGSPASEFQKLKGIGPAKAITLSAAFELGRRIASEKGVKRVKITSPADIAERFIPRLETAKQEEFWALNLDTSNKVISEYVVTKGSLNASIIHPREVFKSAISESAAGVVVLHNHPSGNNKPSKEDINVTKSLAEAGKVIGIPLIDHLIIAGREFYSFAENGQLEN